MAHLAKSVLPVDEEAEILDPHRMCRRDNGFRLGKTSRPRGAFGPARDRAFDVAASMNGR
jgi:hypothetical protein